MASLKALVACGAAVVMTQATARSTEHLVAGAAAKPWLHEEEPLVRYAPQPHLCVTVADGDALELRACGGAYTERQRLFGALHRLGRSTLQLGGGCAAPAAETGNSSVRMAPCGGDSADEVFSFPTTGHGSIKLARSLDSEDELCLAPDMPAAEGAGVHLRPCAPKAQERQQAFLLPRAPPSEDGRSAFLGVNLGGWLILESWMWPAEMLSKHIHDEYSFIATHGGPASALAQEKMQQHWDTFLRPEHLDSLRRFGVTHVRIPIGYWIFDAVYAEEDGFVRGGEPYLARAIGWLKARGMRAVLDLHALPGGQARRQSFTGRQVNEEKFFLNDTEFARGKRSVEELVQLVLKYEADAATSGVVVGVELLNEPSHRHVERTKEFYSEMVPVVRRSLPADRYFVMLSFMDSPHSKSMDWIAEKIVADPGNWSGVVHDPHLYHLFGDNHAPWSEEQDYCKVCCRDSHILRPAEATGVPTIVGEYSIATGFTGWHRGGFVQKNLHNYFSLWSSASSVVGSFLWNFRILVDPAHPMRYLEWSLVDMIDQGYLDRDLAYAADVSDICPGMERSAKQCPDFSNRTVWWNTRCDWQQVGGEGRRLAATQDPILV
eukprot:CAMPEP_0176044514 /NCGR_PEP_ID=MMETSP0120_2-20121206/22093_1 /TAXON_ID=160619 /ORGANISM="Kryptoperidinium foliaceum, Strain CCMP 1326" /LENGTH=604 /DNA_ID=CAMNT_0017377919 /DNA_START=41 /DNA_END=1855 /DNA_ORIENTATION=-